MPDSSSTDQSSDSRSPKHDRKRRKKEKQDKKSKKKRKHKHPSDEKELLKQAKKFLKQKLNAGGEREPSKLSVPAASLQLQPASNLLDEQRISADDYFLKNAEFSSYLLESKGVYFNELKSEETHSMFDEFVEVWNSGRLPARFYNGQVVAPMKRTTFRWQFKGGTDPAAGVVGMTGFLKDEREQHHESARQVRETEKDERKKWRKDQEVVLDELLPKATGREAQLQKKQAKREDAKAREESPDRAFLPGGGDIMGGGDSFAAAKAREAQRDAWKQKQQLAKQEELARRQAEFAASEAAKMAQFRAIVAKGPISIPKRQNPP